MDGILKNFLDFFSRVLRTGFSVAGVLWSVTQFTMTYFSDNAKLMNICNNVLFITVPSIIIAGVYGGFLIRTIYFIKCSIQGRTISIEPGDVLWGKRGVTVIEINKELITDLNQIGRKSLHKKL